MPAEVTKIYDYAIIGNGRSAALISNEDRPIGFAGRDLTARPSSERFWIRNVAAIGAFIQCTTQKRAADTSRTRIFWKQHSWE
jgi:hypothetical protein